jgi:alanine racemase
LELRKSDKGRILAWLYEVHQVPEAVLHDIDIAIFDEKHIPILKKSLTKPANVFIDTGINRNGIPYDKAMKATLDMLHPMFRIQGVTFMLSYKTNQIISSTYLFNMVSY